MIKYYIKNTSFLKITQGIRYLQVLIVNRENGYSIINVEIVYYIENK